MKKYCVCMLLFIAFKGYSQQPQLLQERNYKMNSISKGIQVSAPAGGGNIFYSGLALVSTGNFTNNFLLVKPDTDTLWTRTGPTNLRPGFQAMQNTKDGGMIFFGASKHPTIASLSGLYMQKLDASGVSQWFQNNYFGNLGSNIPVTALVMPDKGFLVGGVIRDQGYSLLKTDSLGNQSWLRDYSKSYRDGVVDIKFTRNGNIIAAGDTEGNFTNTWHPRLMLLNQNGNSLLDKTLVLTGFNRREGMYYNLSSVTPLSDGGFLLTCTTDTVNATYPNGSYLGMVVKVDANLDYQWKYIYRNPAADEYAFTKAQELSDGTILVLGFQFRPTQGGNGFQLYRFSPMGQLLNVYPFTSNICTQVHGVTLDALSDSTYLIGGRCGNNPPITYGYYVAKVKIPGLPLPLPPITITSTKAELAATGAGLGQSYPNPATASAIIPYTLPQQYGKASILIREIATGREIRRYELKRGHSSLNVDLGNLSNGLYLYSLVVDEQPVATKKLAVMK